MIAAGTAILLFLLYFINIGVNATHAKYNFTAFRTEPDHRPVIWDVRLLTSNRSLLAPGYLFFAPKVGDYQGWGPQIYTVDGDLIWNGDLTTIGGITGEFRVCDWKGESGTHLCLHDHPHLKGLKDDEYAMRQLGNRVFDHTYTQVGKNFTDTGPLLGSFPDAHEFNMLPGGKSFLFPAKEVKIVDLRPYGSAKEGKIKNSCFFEADVNTGKPFFTWVSLDHLDVWETYIFPDVEDRSNLTSAVAGDGISNGAWDYMHLNSIDKNAEGDYLISARHLDSIMKIAGLNNVHGVEPGTILWRLGGKKNEFDTDFRFSRQHHVRYVESGPTGDVITIFDNAWEGFPENKPSSDFSSGVIMSINNETMKARLLHRYPNPDHMLSGSRGGMELLSNGNALVGWGYGIPQLTEFSRDGDILFHAHVLFLECMPSGCGKKGLMPFVYRAHKQPWIGKPHWDPKMVVYSRTCNPFNLEVVAYVSWNGATEIKNWRFYISSSPEGPWNLAGTFVKTGFETNVTIPTLESAGLPHVKAEALDADGLVLGTVLGSTFVPGPSIQSDCDDYGCPFGFHYDKHNQASHCSTLEGDDTSNQSISVPFWVALSSLFCLIVVSAAAFEVKNYLDRRKAMKLQNPQYEPLFDAQSTDHVQPKLSIEKGVDESQESDRIAAHGKGDTDALLA